MTKKNKILPSANMLRNILIVYAVLASTVAVFLIAMFLPTYQSQQRIFAETDFRMMMRDAALSAFDQPQRLGGGDKAYIPEAKLVFPMVPGDTDVLYRYQLAQEGTPSETSPETVHFASKPAIQSLINEKSVFECQRLATISFGEYDAYKDTPFVYVGTVRLSDNRQMFIYQNKSTSCAPYWGSVTSSNLVEQLKKAEPYPAS